MRIEKHFLSRCLIASCILCHSAIGVADIWECEEPGGGKRFTNVGKEAIASGCRQLTVAPKIVPPENRPNNNIANTPPAQITSKSWQAPNVTFVAGTSEAALSPDSLYRKLSGSVYELTSQANNLSRQISYGSAVAITSRFALTNCHLVESDKNFLVLTDKNGRRHQGKLAGASPINDYCVIESTSGDLAFVPAIRSYISLREGERVYAIGNPRGLSQTISDGLISGKRVARDMRVIQTTAPISSGSSGGGLFDGAGNLIGITTAYLRESQNINLAIPAEDYWHKLK